MYSENGYDDGVVMTKTCGRVRRACPMIWLIWEVVDTHNLHMVALCMFRRVYTVPLGTLKDVYVELGRWIVIFTEI